MLYAILIVAFLAVLLGLLWYYTNRIHPRKVQKLPSGKLVPSRDQLAQMKAGNLAKEYTKADLKWLRDYVLRQLPKVPLGAENVQKHMAWIDISREIDMALYGWRSK